jgi:hypothetical protein
VGADGGKGVGVAAGLGLADQRGLQPLGPELGQRIVAAPPAPGLELARQGLGQVLGQVVEAGVGDVGQQELLVLFGAQVVQRVQRGIGQRKALARAEAAHHRAAQPGLVAGFDGLLGQGEAALELAAVGQQGAVAALAQALVGFQPGAFSPPTLPAVATSAATRRACSGS